MDGRKDGKTDTPGNEVQEVVKPGSPQTLKDEEMVTERRVARRSFLTVAGTLLAGGALAIASGARAAQQADSGAKKDDDADKKKESTTKSKKSKKAKSEKGPDADKAKEKPAAPPQ